jgi:uncharacterized protein
MNKELEKIIKKLAKLKPILKENYFVKEIGIFGSYVKNKQTKNSDIDILVDFTDDIDIFTVADLINFLSTIFGKKIDIVNKRTLRQRIGENILAEVKYV